MREQLPDLASPLRRQAIEDIFQVHIRIMPKIASGRVVDIINGRVEGDLPHGLINTLDAYEGLTLRVVSSSPINA